MKLQQKLKNASLEPFEREKVSFISNKQTEKISYGSSTIYHKPTAANTLGNHANSAIQKKSIPSPVQPKPSDKAKDVDIWSSNFTNSKPSTNLASVSTKNNVKAQGFDAFNNVFPNSNIQKTSTSETNKISNNNNSNLF